MKFASYFRDTVGQDYADQRYYTASAGRFYTADPAGIKTADPKNPTSWNMYAYAYGDPVNFNDQTGALPCWIAGFSSPGGGGDDGGSGCLQDPCTATYMVNFVEVPNPFCTYGGPELREGEDLPTCDDFLTWNLGLFLQSNDPALLKWDANLATDLVNEGASVGVDPRLFASIATLESRHGTHFSGNNPFGLGPGKSYASPMQAIHAEGSTLAKYIYQWGETSVSQLYSGNNWVTTGRWHQITVTYPAYCSQGLGGPAAAAACQAAGQTIAGFLTSQHGNRLVGLTAGNPNRLGYPCP